MAVRAASAVSISNGDGTCSSKLSSVCCCGPDPRRALTAMMRTPDSCGTPACAALAAPASAAPLAVLEHVLPGNRVAVLYSPIAVWISLSPTLLSTSMNVHGSNVTGVCTRMDENEAVRASIECQWEASASMRLDENEVSGQCKRRLFGGLFLAVAVGLTVPPWVAGDKGGQNDCLPPPS